MRKILTHLGEPLEPPPMSPARGPPADSSELVQAHDDRDVFQATERRGACDRHSPSLTAAASEAPTKPPWGRTRRASAPTPENSHSRRGRQAFQEPFVGPARRQHAARRPLMTSAMLAEVPLAELSLERCHDARVAVLFLRSFPGDGSGENRPAAASQWP